jgi:alpha-tubulin suppressor-like RCC1 family protein
VKRISYFKIVSDFYVLPFIDLLTILFSRLGAVYGWGMGSYGQLGTGSEADEEVPKIYKFSTARSSTRIRVVWFSI